MSDSNNATDATTTTHYVQEMKHHEELMLEFSEDEADLVARMFRLVGKRWSLIAGRIPGRSAEEVEKYWTLKCALPTITQLCSSSASSSE